MTAGSHPPELMKILYVNRIYRQIIFFPISLVREPVGSGILESCARKQGIAYLPLSSKQITRKYLKENEIRKKADKEEEIDFKTGSENEEFLGERKNQSLEEQRGETTIVSGGKVVKLLPALHGAQAGIIVRSAP